MKKTKKRNWNVVIVTIKTEIQYQKRKKNNNISLQNSDRNSLWVALTKIRQLFWVEGFSNYFPVEVIMAVYGFWEVAG